MAEARPEASKLASDPDEVRSHAESILGLDISGHVVRRLWIEQASDIAEEYYASFSLDRSVKQHLGILSAQGGMDIEAVAEENPDAIAKVWVDPVDGLSEADCRAWVQAARIDKADADEITAVLLNLYKAYVESDADLVEINPLVLTSDGKILALDAKVTIDANSLFRHSDYSEYDATQIRDDRERAAEAIGLKYVGLEGTVGVIANGAGLAMSTIDVVNQVGGRPANFLDLGGGASPDVMTGAMSVLNDDPTVRSIFINVFGGITRCEEVAKGIVAALARVEMKAPMVIRFDGMTVAEGCALLEPHLGPKLMMAPTMLDAARKAAELAAAAEAAESSEAESSEASEEVQS